MEVLVGMTTQTYQRILKSILRLGRQVTVPFPCTSNNLLTPLPPTRILPIPPHMELLKLAFLPLQRKRMFILPLLPLFPIFHIPNQTQPCSMLMWGLISLKELEFQPQQRCRPMQVECKMRDKLQQGCCEEGPWQKSFAKINKEFWLCESNSVDQPK